MEPHEKEQHVHALFERIAPTYDTMNDVLSGRFHKQWRAKTMRRMRVQPGQTAVDLCCGTCDWTIALAEASVYGDIIGVDFSAQMLSYGAEKIQLRALQSRIRLVQANVYALPLDEHSVDFATIGFGLRNVAHLDHVLAEMTRVVKPGGKVVCLELSKPLFPPMRWLAGLYFERMMPLLAHVLVKKYRDYRWLPESLATFPDPLELCRHFSKAGLHDVRWWPLTGGIAALHIGTKR